MREGGRRRKEATGFYQWCTLAAKAFWTLVDFCSEYELRCQPCRHILTEATAFTLFRLASAIVTRHRESVLGVRTMSGVAS